MSIATHVSIRSQRWCFDHHDRRSRAPRQGLPLSPCPTISTLPLRPLHPPLHHLWVSGVCTLNQNFLLSLFPCTCFLSSVPGEDFATNTTATGVEYRAYWQLMPWRAADTFCRTKVGLQGCLFVSEHCLDQFPSVYGHVGTHLLRIRPLHLVHTLEATSSMPSPGMRTGCMKKSMKGSFHRHHGS